MKAFKILLFVLIGAVVVYFGASYYLITNEQGYYDSSYENIDESIKTLSHPRDFVQTLVGMTPTYELSYDQNQFYEVTNKHIIFVETKNKENFDIVQEDGLYTDNIANYMAYQKIDIYYPEYFHPLAYNFKKVSGGRGFRNQVNADFIFYATESVFNKNMCKYEFSTNIENSKLTYILIRNDEEVFGLISYYRRYVKIDDSIILNTILDNLIVF